uniref:Polymerase PA n=1 Tax=Phasmatodean orthomyxo-related virus OKIAV172 TaxID=2746281 RepID=A0A7D7IUW9_9ORTO|nr:polymerase PA [Phasmatodean orthomyxo-related virus OKIAV172]
MTDKHHDLIHNYSLYPMEFINNFGVTGAHWRDESNRKRELSLRHDLVCVYLCNLQEKPYEEMIEQLSQLKRKRDGEDDSERETKRLRPGELVFTKTVTETPGTSQMSLSGPSTSSGETSTSRGTMKSDGEAAEIPYRFILIEGMPSPELIQNEYAKQWEMPVPTTFWDIIDTHLKKFIEVKVSLDPNGSIERYQEKKLGMGIHTALCVVDPRTGDCDWHDHEGGLNGEEKVRMFLIQRYEIMRNIGIMDSEIQEQRDLIKYVFPDAKFNILRDLWISDWWPLNRGGNVSSFVTAGDKRPFGVDARELLEELDTLEGPDRNEVVQWRGKILPEGWTHNLIEEGGSDSEMVTYFLDFIKREKLHFYPQDHNIEGDEDLINCIEEAWKNSSNNVFSMDIQSSDKVNALITAWLGVGKKNKIHNETCQDTKQPKNKEIRKTRYDTYFDEIIRRMNSRHGYQEKPFNHLLRDRQERDHPISTISMDASNRLISEIGEHKAAIFSSKLTNFYSRIGGAFLRTKKSGKTTHSDVAIMPIYATLRSQDDTEIKRAVSGIVIRGPQHARTPTDRINLVTVEILPNNQENKYLLGVINKHSLWHNNNFIVAARRNAVMKEDSAFITFNQNAMFVPANLLGVMTMENPDVRADTNMAELVSEFFEENKEWFVERFTEGVLMSAIGNSRDEGYFAQLRKVFMMVFCYRRNRVGANWDIKAYCKKVNECLLDNPFSMHFHRTLLKILHFYSNRETM